MKRIFKNIDSFGYPIHLKFDKNDGPKYKTLVGAVTTVVFMVLSIGVVYLVFSPYQSKTTQTDQNGENSGDNKNDTIFENIRMDNFKDIIDKIGSVGGTLFLLYNVLEYIAHCYSRFSYRNRLMKRLYFARSTSDKKLFL